MPRKKQTFYTRGQLRNNIFAVGEHEHKVYMPNEIFDELINGLNNDRGEYVAGFYDVEGNKINDFKSSTHISYAYAYIYLSHYMYRYCKFYTNGYLSKDIDEKMIKQNLGFPATSDTYTYISKKGGVLERLGYIKKESDKPFQYNLCETQYLSEHLNEIWILDYFDMESELTSVFCNSKNRKINYPLKAFERDVELSEDDTVIDDRTGTFWHIKNTHMIDIDVFIFCMADPDIGVEGFYLYSFMFSKCGLSGVLRCSIKKIVTQTGLGIKTVRTQLENLEKRNMISNDHKPYCLDKKDWQITKTNDYGVLPYSEFISNELDFKEIPKQRRISAKRYQKEIGFVINEENEAEYSEEITHTKKYNLLRPEKLNKI